MTFVNEKISKDNHNKYCLAKLDFRENNYPDNYSQWTIDKEREVFLYTIYGGRPDTGGQYYYQFLYWKGHFIQFDKEYLQRANKENNWTAHIKITSLRLIEDRRLDQSPVKLPENINRYKDEILKEIEQALIVYGTGGLFCRAENYKLICENNV